VARTASRAVTVPHHRKPPLVDEHLAGARRLRGRLDARLACEAVAAAGEGIPAWRVVALDTSTVKE
jgi:hypothetical protein